MTVVWGIHNVERTFDFIERSEVAIGWKELGDPRALARDRERLKEAILHAYPDAKPGAIPVWAGMLIRFVHEVKIGDFIVYPNRTDSTIAVGRVTGEFEHVQDDTPLSNRRRVEWLRKEIPRASFSQGALYEAGSALTLFLIRNHASEFIAAASSSSTEPEPASSPEDDIELAIDEAEELATAARVEESARDFIIRTLYRAISPHDFERFVADLLSTLGYRTRVTSKSGDGGFDVVAHRDPLAIEPPIIKVQCKQMISSIGAPEVQKLIGALAAGGSEVGLFVTLGGYAAPALSLDRNRNDLRLLNGDDVAQLVMDNYDALSAEWQRIIPLKRTWVVDQ